MERKESQINERTQILSQMEKEVMEDLYKSSVADAGFGGAPAQGY